MCDVPHLVPHRSVRAGKLGRCVRWNSKIERYLVDIDSVGVTRVPASSLRYLHTCEYRAGPSQIEAALAELAN